jgi:hypothetical protein
MSTNSNWNELKQDLIDDIVSFKDDFVRDAQDDIVKRLVRKGLSERDLDKEGTSVKMQVDSAAEYDKGKIYFEEVFEEVSQPGWTDTI